MRGSGGLEGEASCGCGGCGPLGRIGSQGASLDSGQEKSMVEWCVSWAPGLGLGWEREIRSLDVALVSVAQPATPDKLDSRNCKII